MSSFKRKAPTKEASPGTRTYSGSPSTTLVSTGIPSLDDILGGGLPLSCSFLITAPDYHSSYSDLILKYFVSQGLEKGQKVLIVHRDATSFVKECMWTAASNKSSTAQAIQDAEDNEADKAETKIKIAWRYEEMKQFQTTVASHSSEEFCSTFDLTNRIPDVVLERVIKADQLCLLDVDSIAGSFDLLSTIKELERLLEATATPTRICIPAFGSPDWGDVTSTTITIFLHRLQVLLRRYPHACASVGLAPHLGKDSWGGRGWTQKLGWLVDAFIELSAFSSNPALSALSPSHHGVLEVHTLPAPHTLVSPSDKHSVLRGLSSTTMSAGGSGENNLAFKCTRKRLIFETLHLDVEGGVGERRTMPSATRADDHSDHRHEPTLPKSAFASIGIHLDADVAATQEVPPIALIQPTKPQSQAHQDKPLKLKRPKKSVAFQSDRPDLYDF